MTKAEAIKHAKRGVQILKREAIASAKKHGDNRHNRFRATTTGQLMQKLDLKPTGWGERSKVKGALTRALQEAVDLGLIERATAYYRREAAWRYTGPEVRDAIQHYNNRVAEERRKLALDLRTLGISVCTAQGAHEPNDELRITVKDIRQAATRARALQRDNNA